MMRARLAATRLAALLRQFPVVAVVGPRQIGKSTLAQRALPEYESIDLENPADFDRLAADPMFVLSQHRRLVVDEAQRLPALFPVLRHFVDRHPRSKVVLLGSASPHLAKAISESLAGRVGFLELGPISIFEEATAEQLWVHGGFPRIHWSQPRARPAEWYPAYLATCLERDIPQLGFRVSVVRLRRLLTMIAHGQGGICNLSELGAALGIDYHSVAHSLDIFEGVFLVRRLQPYFANIGKRLVKSPKLYVRDSGLLHSLLGIPFTRQALLAHPKAGASFETFCIEQIIAHARLADPAAEAFFFGTHTGVEVDLVLRRRGELVPIEIKLGVTPPDPKGLLACMDALAANRGYVVNMATKPVEIRRGVTMCALPDLLRRLRVCP